MNVSLVVVQGKPEGQEIPIRRREFLVGRDASCHLRPRSELVSKQHCVILRRDNGVFVRDLNSTNGTFVNNDRIQGQTELQDGDLIRIGPLVFSVKIAAAAGREPQPRDSDEELQAVDWLLEEPSDAGQPAAADSTGDTAVTGPGGAAVDPTADTVAEGHQQPAPKEPAAKPPAEEPAKARSAAAEVAGSLLDKLLNPRKKKP